jgi:four helix bundle protein
MAKKGDDISGRLLEFAARIIKLADSLRRTPSGRAISGQLLRSGTSAGANYEEARAGESGNDFVHKLGIRLKELREASYWLRVIAKAELQTASRMEEIIRESEELTRIIAQSIVTAKRNARQAGFNSAADPSVREDSD